MALKIFFELLSNIGVVQIHTNGEIMSLGSKKSFKKDIADIINIHYNGHLETYDLPFEVLQNDNISKLLDVNRSTLRCKYLINRIVKPQLDDQILKRDPFTKLILAKELNHHNEFLEVACKFCSSKLFRIDKNFPKLLDLPDDNWREMMDLWHCHKPDDTNSSGIDSLFSSKIVPKYDTLLIGDTYFLLDMNIFVKSLIIESKKTLCYSCKNVLGSVYNVDNNSTACKIFKQNLYILNSSNSKKLEFKNIDNLSLQLLKGVKDYGSRFFFIGSKKANNANTRLLIWCLDYGLSIAINNTKLENRLKIMYRQINNDDEKDIQMFGNLKKAHNVEEILIEDSNQAVNQVHQEIQEHIDKINQAVTFSKSANLVEGWKLSYI
ncbi:hypothetical protein QEN19_002604 [Hanseniaspora menglaensis]